jgi:hypothetical protein
VFLVQLSRPPWNPGRNYSGVGLHPANNGINEEKP